MHICFFIGSISASGGTERITVALANKLVINGFEVSIVSLYHKEKMFFAIDERIRLYSILKSDRRYLLYFPIIVSRLYRIIAKTNVDILVNVDVILALFSLPIKMLLSSLKVISWEHFNFKANLGIRRRDWARYLSKNYADTIVTLTNVDKIFYLAEGDCRAKVYSIKNFVDGLPVVVSPCNQKVVLAVGRYNYQKGFDILVDIWSLVKTNENSAGWILKIVGDGDEKEAITKKVKTLNLNDSIEILPSDRQIADYYLSSSIYVMTSRFEGLPMVLIEAKTYGLPIISFDCLTGPSDLIRNEIDGYLIPMAENKSMADKILTLMSNENLRKQMGYQARLDSAHYCSDEIFLQWKQLFKQVCE